MAKRQAAARGNDPPPQTLEVLDSAATFVADSLAVVVEDEQFIAKIVPAIQGFLRNVAGFFAIAAALERTAKATLDRARQLPAPASVDEDVGIQTFVKSANGVRKQVEEHWAICQVVSGFHKRLTGARSRATTALEDAASIAQTLHNRYVEAERRRVAEEQDKKRREAEEQARQDRERELQQMEYEALKREATMVGLSEREQYFIELVSTNHSSVAAARTAGYKDPAKQGPRLMQTPKIQAAIEAKYDAAAIRQQAAAVKEQPLDVQVEDVKPAIAKATGAYDRTYHDAELLDEPAFIAAIINGKHGIPWDVLSVNRSKLREYAGSLQKRINLWPGVRYKKTMKTI